MKFTDEQEEMVSRANIVRDLREKHTGLGLHELAKIVNWVEGNEERAHALAHDFVHIKTSWHEQYRDRFKRIEERLEDRPTKTTIEAMIENAVKSMRRWCHANFRGR